MLSDIGRRKLPKCFNRRLTSPPKKRGTVRDKLIPSPTELAEPVSLYL